MNSPSLITKSLIFLPLFFLTGCSDLTPEAKVPEKTWVITSGRETKSFPRFEMPKVDLAASRREFDDLTQEVGKLVAKRDFKGLDEKAREFRESRARLIGGGWKIASFYYVLGLTPSNQNGKIVKDWKALIQFSKNWQRDLPQSITARIALARTYLDYAWEVRGTGYANSVSDEKWSLFHAQLDLAANELREAAKLTEHCPVFYQVLMEIANAQNWDPVATKTVYDEAIAYEPTYQYYYTARARSLMPRWGGRPGEWEAFAENVKTNIGGPHGLQMYYLMVAAVSRAKTQDFPRENKISWQDARDGFKSLVEEYGATTESVTRFGRIAITFPDTQAACEAFKLLPGDEGFDPESWESKKEFEASRRLAIQFCTM